MRRHRDRKRAVAADATAADLRWRALADTDPALAVAEWSEATLKVPIIGRMQESLRVTAPSASAAAR